MRLNLRDPRVHIRPFKPNSALKFPEDEEQLFQHCVKTIHVDVAAFTPARSLLDSQCSGYGNPSPAFVTIH